MQNINVEETKPYYTVYAIKCKHELSAQLVYVMFQ